MCARVVPYILPVISSLHLSDILHEYSSMVQQYELVSFALPSLIYGTAVHRHRSVTTHNSSLPEAAPTISIPFRRTSQSTLLQQDLPVYFLVKSLPTYALWILV